MAIFGKCFAILFLCSVDLMTNAAPKNLEDEQVEETTVLFAEKPTNVTASRGDTVTFSCDITYEDGKPVPADDESIISIWLKDALVQMAGVQKLTKNPRLSVEGRSLVVSDVTLEDAGSYACQLSTWGQPRLEHHLVVYTAPTVKAEKSKIVATAGDDVVLSCNATGSPTPTISWKIKDEPVASGESSLTGKQLTLEQVSHRQAGKYACIADNGVGEPAKATIELDVMYKPVIKIDKAWIHSGENNQAELTCVIHGQPNPQVVWFHNGDELEKDSPHWTQSKVDSNTYTLELKNLKREHFGTYECRASNTIGRSEGMIELSGVAREAVFTSAPNGNLEDSFRLSWTVESYSPIKEYLLKYRKVDLNETNSEDVEWSSVTVPAEQQQPKDSTVSHSHSHEFLLKGLEKATEYEVSLQVVNTFGSNKPSIFRFATLGSTVSTWTSGSASNSVCTILTVVSAVVLTMVRL